MNRGASLLLAIVLIACCLIMAAELIKIVYNCHASLMASLSREQAFYLAQAGLEQAKVKLVKNQNWFTDLPHQPKDSSGWLINQAVGQKYNFGQGYFKVVREKDKNRFYSVGYRGKGVVVLKLEFTSSPFKTTLWSEL